MRYAVISDIHNNLEAFNAALKDIEQQNVDQICCLGDLLGYGPNPIECVDKMIKLRDSGKLAFCLSGNHDQAYLFDPNGFNRYAQIAILWTRKQLEKGAGRLRSNRMDFLGDLDYCRNKTVNELLFVHGSPRNCLNEYVFSEDVDDSDKMSSLFDTVKKRFSAKYCFMGHTHVPGIFVDRVSSGKFEYYSFEEIQREFGGKYKLGEESLLINVGSVGQPRDGDPRSCYVIIDYEPKGADNYIEYRRVEYDINKTVEAFERIPEFKLPFYDCDGEEVETRGINFLAERIKTGR